MAGKKSRALAAAEKLAGPQVELQSDDERPWSRAKVERAWQTFHDVERVPAYDEDGIRRRVIGFLCFADRLEAGAITDEARSLAQSYVERGYAWLARHPRYAPFTQQQWTTEMVETVVQWFADVTTAPLGSRDGEEVGRRLRTFAAVVGSGGVESGDAETLAQAFLDHATRWMQRHPEVRASFAAES